MDKQSASIQLQLRKANQLLRDAEILMQHGGLSSVISRLYYACFHATTALLQTKNLVAKTHTGLLAVLHREFVQKEEFDPEQSKFFSGLLRERMEDDYGNALVTDIDEVRAYLQPSKNYIDYIVNLIQKNDSN
jgi:uncharacterized protein (UPF0332 family)